MGCFSKSSQKNKLFVIAITVIAILLIGIGIYIIYTHNNKVIFGRALDNLKDDIEKHYIPDYNSEKFESYTTESDIVINAKNKYAENPTLYSQELLSYLKLMQNVNNLKSKIIIKQDNKKEKAFFSISSTINNNELFLTKYLIENNTEYYYIKGFQNSYINNGNNNYFESITNNDSNIDNYNYIYESIVTSLKNNLKNEYFTKNGEKIKINNQEKTLQKISIEIDNKRLIEIYNNILSDLKSDKKADEILTSIDKDFKNYKIKSNEKLLNNKKIVCSVYVDNITYAPKKYKLDVIDNNEIKTIVYEKGVIDYYIDNKLELNLKIEYKQNETNINIFKDNINQGKITFINKNNLYAISLNAKNNTNSIKLLIKNELKNKKKNKSYQRVLTISSSIYSNNVSLLDFTMNMNIKVKKGTKINENVDNAIFAKDLNTNKSTALQNQLNNVLKILMS